MNAIDRNKYCAAAFVGGVPGVHSPISAGNRLLLIAIVALALVTPHVVRATDETLDTYWPIHSTQRSWDLIGSRQRELPESKTLMTVTNKMLGENQIELWFSNKQGQVDGQSDIERYQYCANTGGHPWLFLTEYIDKKPGKPIIEHPVASTRILFTPNNGKTYDLVANGTYVRCGSKGQPYLFWDVSLDVYRIQVWGYLTENAKQFKWYWDATVSKPATIANDCVTPSQTVRAIKVQEAWWNTFGVPSGKWDLGSGEIGSDGLPTGNGTAYGRSVWHAQGQLPYYLTGSPDGKTVDWCMKRVKQGQ
jgi:hypothetical protein